MKYIFKRAKNVSFEEEKFIKRLKLNNGNILLHFYVNRNKKNCYVVLVWDGKNIIAWGLIFLIGKIWEFSVYVKRSYRRKGIGSKIYRSIKKKLKILNIQIDVCRHDNVSGKFFDKMFKTNKKYGR